jgi:hypothetical protein
MDFTPKRPTEVEVFTVDFTSLLGTGETILSAAWSCSLKEGADPAAASMIQGSATVSGSKVSTVISGGVAACWYAPICTALTSLGQVLVLPESGYGILHVLP